MQSIYGLGVFLQDWILYKKLMGRIFEANVAVVCVFMVLFSRTHMIIFACQISSYKTEYKYFLFFLDKF